MAMNQLQSDLLRLLSLRKKKQGTIIKEIDKLIKVHSLSNVKRWRNLSNKKNTLLHELVERDMPDVIRHVVLEEHKFDINIQRDTDGVTPLQLAAKSQNWDIYDLLMELGAEIIDSADQSQLSPDELKKRATNIVWLDLEMTSFDNPEILECAVIITDKDLKELTRKNWVIRFDQKVLDSLADWHQKTFADTDKGGNGLFADVVKSKLTNDQVEEELLTLLKQHCAEKKCPLGGSSVHIDKEVLKLRMGKVHDFLHYRIIDVTSFQGIIRRWAPWIETQIKKQLYKKGQETVNHRAMDDIEWSIAFMKEFQPILTRQPNNANNPKNKPSNARPLRHSVSSSGDIQNLAIVAHNHVVDNKTPFQAIEQPSPPLKPLEYERKSNVKSLKLSKEDQQIYDASPHLQEVFQNNQKLIVYQKGFTNENRSLNLSSKQYDNNGIKLQKTSTIKHCVHRKLLLVEIEFLTIYATNDKSLVVYAGAAPGLHINYLSRLFPQLDFDLIDTKDFVVAETNEIRNLSEQFTNDLAERYGTSNRDILFICNVQTSKQDGDSDKNLMDDMMNQSDWHRLMKPRASLLNFRPPRTPNKFKYLKGNLVVEPWASRYRIECRLIVEKEQKLIEYDYSVFENSISHFHNYKRIRYYEHQMDEVNGERLDHCYDCRAEIFILREYLMKTKKTTNEADIKIQMAQMLSDISKELVDKRKKSFVYVTEALGAIQKHLPASLTSDKSTNL